MHQPEILANLLVGSNGATTKDGSSKALTHPLDRERFHKLRQRARAIVIGGSTFRNEPYLRSTSRDNENEIPLYVATRISGLVNPNTIFSSLNPILIVRQALSDAGSPILIEGGVNFLRELIAATLIDELYITRVEKVGDGLFLDEDFLTSKYALLEWQDEGEIRFEIWRPII